jgi:hypothetical protein
MPHTTLLLSTQRHPMEVTYEQYRSDRCGRDWTATSGSARSEREAGVLPVGHVELAKQFHDLLGLRRGTA